MPQTRDPDEQLAFGELLLGLIDTYDEAQAMLAELNNPSMSFEEAATNFTRISDGKQFRVTLTEVQIEEEEDDDDDTQSLH